MDKLYESKFMKVLQRFGEKVAGNKALNSVSAGLMMSLGLILVGAIFQIIATLLTIFKWTTATSDVYKFFMTPYNMTMGLLAVAVAFGVSYSYAKQLGIKALANGINSLILFLLVAAPATTVTLQDGKTTFTGLDNSALGSAGLFAAIIIALLSVRIAFFFEKHHLVVRMPDSVPQSLQDSFSALIPLIVNIVIWHVINTLVLAVFKVSLPIAISVVLSLPLHALTSLPGVLVLLFLVGLLWSFGIHGTAVVYMAIMPVFIQAVSQNAALVAAGKPAVFTPILLMGAMASCGGAGNTLPLALMGLRSKSEQLKAISKAAVIPGIFGINEPVAFGYPVMYNPVLAIPYVLNMIVTAIVLWGGYSIGFLKPAYVVMMSSMPVGVNEFLGSMAWQNLFIPVVGFVVASLLYWPFFKTYEKELIEKEAAAKKEAAKEEAII